jgi:hypothetical protein
MTNDPLTAETELALVPGIRTRMGASGHILIDTPAGPVMDARVGGRRVLPRIGVDQHAVRQWLQLRDPALARHP